ncbi:MAG: PHB depolymerase family esterase [Pseudomonadota bacterium]
MLRFLATALTLLALSLPGPAMAQPCDGEGGRCEIDGGHYHLAAPEGQAVGAVMFLHGYGGTGAGVVRNRGLMARFNDRGYAVIAPQGMPRFEDDRGGAWNSRSSAGRRDDVVFLARVADDAADRLGIDRAGVVISGFSGGGMMTWAVACRTPDAFAAYGPIAGLLWRPLPERCAGPVRFHHTHGWVDPVVPLEGRILGGGRIVQGDLFKGLDMLRQSFGCVSPAPDSYGRREIYQTRTWSSCDDGGTITMALHPGGHAIPSGWADMLLDWYEAPES